MQLLWRTPKTLLHVFKKLNAQEQYMMSSRFILNTNVSVLRRNEVSYSGSRRDLAGWASCSVLLTLSGTSGFLHEFYLKSELVFSLVYSVSPRVIGHKHETCHHSY